MKATLLASALLLSGLAVSAPASAAPVLPAAGLADPSSVTLARHYRGRPGPGYRYAPGHSYYGAPPGWRRHARRPGDWRRRGCILVGPVWYCP